MISADVLRLLADLGGLGVLALFLVVGGLLVRQGMALFRDHVLPLVTNHIEHLEVSYDKLATAITGMKQVQEAQAQALETHNELTRALIERLPKNYRVKKLLD
jgi:hypothetical protein